MADPDTLTDLTAQLATAPWTGLNGSAFIGIVVGILNDLLTEGARTALRAGVLFPFNSGPELYDQPLEALELLGRDALLPHYPHEQHYLTLRARLRTKWDFWTGSMKAGLVSELQRATPSITPGGSIATIEVPNDGTITVLPSGYWSAFMVHFSIGNHIVGSTLSGVATCGTAVCGTDRLGPDGLNTPDGAAYWGLLQDVIQRYKPAQWVCWDVVFETTAPHKIRIPIQLRNYANGSDTLYVYQV